MIENMAKLSFNQLEYPNAVNLDIKDRRILSELDLDARQSNSQIAKKAKLSKNIVNYRLNRLEKAGIIKGYNTLFDYSKLGYFLIRVYLDFYELDPVKEEELIKYLKEESTTGNVCRTIGNWDLVVSFYVKNVREFWVIWSRFLERFRRIILEYNTNIVTKEILFSKAYFMKNDIGDEPHKKSLFSKRWVRGYAVAEDIDETDLKIVELLTEDGRAPIGKIARAVKLNSMSVIYRIKQLISKGIILGYRFDSNIEKIGYARFMVDLELEDTTVAASLVEYCQNHPHIVSTVESISDNNDFEFDIETEGFNTFLEIIDDMKHKFPGKIRNYKYVRVLENIKNKYMPMYNSNVCRI